MKLRHSDHYGRTDAIGSWRNKGKRKCRLEACHYRSWQTPDTTQTPQSVQFPFKRCCQYLNVYCICMNYSKYIYIYTYCGDKTRYATIACATAKSSIADVLRRPCGVARKRNAVLHLECGQARSIAIAATAASKASVTQWVVKKK